MQNKDSRIKKEREKISKQLEGLSEQNKKIVGQLIENAAFMAIQLEDLRAAINQQGVVIEYRTGQATGVKKSPEIEVYNSLIKLYSNVIKQLTDLLGKVEPEEEEDELLAFIARKPRPGE